MTKLVPDHIATWASRTSHVSAVILIGSHVRFLSEAIDCADANSDWDFIVITSRPEKFVERDWTEGLNLGRSLVYALRDGVVGNVKRATAIFREVEIDFVIVPAMQWRVRRCAFTLGLHHWSESLKRSLSDLAVVARPGYRFVYDVINWEPFYKRVIAEIPNPRLCDKDILTRAELFVADYVWIRRKLARGEILAAQRTLHRSLAEINFQLLHELKLRRGERSFPEGRRIERAASTTELHGVTIRAMPTAEDLRAALDSASVTCKQLMHALVGIAWQWPEI